MTPAPRPPTPHLLNAFGWLLFGTAMMLGWLDIMPWHLLLATAPVYILIGFLMSLPLGRAYDRLGVGRGSIGRTVAIIVVGSYLAGLLWITVFYVYRIYGAAMVHSVIIGGPSTLGIQFRDEWIFDGAFSDGALPLFGWSLLRLGVRYNTQLGEQREQALRAEAAARVSIVSGWFSR